MDNPLKMDNEIKNINDQIDELKKKKQSLLEQTQEKFESKKFWKGFLGLCDPVGWSKDIVGILNIRKLIIYTIILISVAVYFYIQGRSTKPVMIDIGCGKEAIIEINEEGDQLYIDKSGYVWIRNKEGKVLKQINAKDIQGLKAKLSPIGFQLVPIGIMGAGVGESGAGFEVGGGISFFRYWKMELETFLTNRGIYLGTSYQITDNSGIGLGVGKGYIGDNRIILYYRWRF